MTSVFNPNEPTKRRFRMTITAKLCPMKFVMYEVGICYDYQLTWFLYYVGWRKCHEHLKIWFKRCKCNVIPWLVVTITKQVICCLEFCLHKKPHWQRRNTCNNPINPIILELFISIFNWDLLRLSTNMVYVLCEG